MTQFQIKAVEMASVKYTVIKTSYSLLLSNSFILSGGYSVSSWFERATIMVQPMMIKVKDGKSYLQMNFSLRNLIDNRVLKTMPAAVIVDKRTKSAKGRTAPWIIDDKVSNIKPKRYLKVR